MGFALASRPDDISNGRGLMAMSGGLEPIEWIAVVVTCRTSGCINEGVPIETFRTDGGIVQCGPCEVLITDVMEAP